MIALPMVVSVTALAEAQRAGVHVSLMAHRDAGGRPHELRVLRNGELVSAIPAQYARVARAVYFACK